jgi:transcriptional regulator with XRE-family HTH domain
MKKNLKIQVAQRISAILEEKGLKQQDLVESTGMTKSYVSQIMHGTVNLTLETIELLEKALKAPIVQCPKQY